MSTNNYFGFTHGGTQYGYEYFFLEKIDPAQMLIWKRGMRQSMSVLVMASIRSIFCL